MRIAVWLNLENWRTFFIFSVTWVWSHYHSGKLKQISSFNKYSMTGKKEKYTGGGGGIGRASDAKAEFRLRGGVIWYLRPLLSKPSKVFFFFDNGFWKDTYDEGEDVEGGVWKRQSEDAALDKSNRNHHAHQSIDQSTNQSNNQLTYHLRINFFRFFQGFGVPSWRKRTAAELGRVQGAKMRQQPTISLFQLPSACFAIVCENNGYIWWKTQTDDHPCCQFEALLNGQGMAIDWLNE